MCAFLPFLLLSSCMAISPTFDLGEILPFPSQGLCLMDAYMIYGGMFQGTNTRGKKKKPGWPARQPRIPSKVLAHSLCAKKTGDPPQEQNCAKKTRQLPHRSSHAHSHPLSMFFFLTPHHTSSSRLEGKTSFLFSFFEGHKATVAVMTRSPFIF